MLCEWKIVAMHDAAACAGVLLCIIIMCVKAHHTYFDMSLLHVSCIALSIHTLYTRARGRLFGNPDIFHGILASFWSQTGQSLLHCWEWYVRRCVGAQQESCRRVLHRTKEVKATKL